GSLGVARGTPARLPHHRTRHRLARRGAAFGWHVGRTLVHGDRIPRRLLHQLPPVPVGLPRHGLGSIRARWPVSSRRNAEGAVPDLLILAPLALEAAAVGRSRPAVRVLRTGMGPVRAAGSAERAAGMPARAVAVAGLC